MLGLRFGFCWSWAGSGFGLYSGLRLNSGLDFGISVCVGLGVSSWVGGTCTQYIRKPVTTIKWFLFLGTN